MSEPDDSTAGVAEDAFRYPGVGPGAGEFDPDDPEGEDFSPDEDLDDDESWLVPDTRRRVRITIPTLILTFLIIAAGAFWGGAVVDKHFGATSTSSTSGLAAFSRSGAAGRFAGFGAEGGTTTGGATAGAGGFGAGGFTTPAAEGTLTAVSGNTLTVTSTTGSTVKVVMTASTVVTRSGKGAPGKLTVGDTVRVIGTAKGQTVTATSITATAAGVTAATGGFGGGGGFGSAAGGSTTSGGGFGTSSSSGSSSGGFGS